MIISVASGKGGTGKTSLVGALAAVGENQVLCDADVDAADLHLLLAPRILARHDFYAGHQAVIREDSCLKCGECLDWCRFQAISDDFVVNPLLCEGCGVCWALCPGGAIDFPENRCGEWFISETRFGPLVHARLGVAAENSGKLVNLVRREARRVAALADHFRMPSYILVNKADLHCPMARFIRQFCDLKGYHFLGFLPFTPAFTQAQVEGKTILEYGNNQIKSQLTELWKKLRKAVQQINPARQ